MATEQCTFESLDDLDLTHRCLDDSEQFFANVVGCIEDVLMDENFLDLHAAFMEDHWQEFDDDQENKLVYMDIFKKYTETIEKFIEGELLKMMPGFKMYEFERELRKRTTELEGEIFEILSTFTDFVSFKEKFMDYKAVKEGKIVDLATDLSVKKCPIDSWKW